MILFLFVIISYLYINYVFTGSARKSVVDIRHLSDVHDVSRSLCGRIRHDMRAIQRLNQTSQVILLKYEDLALEPHTTVTRLYKHLDTTIPSSIWRWISSNTKAENPDGVMGTRRNSVVVVNKWRRLLSPQANRVVVKNCRDVLQYFNYTI